MSLTTSYLRGEMSEGSSVNGTGHSGSTETKKRKKNQRQKSTNSHDNGGQKELEIVLAKQCGSGDLPGNQNNNVRRWVDQSTCFLFIEASVSQVRKYYCERCAKEFRDKSKLTDHLTTHSNKRNWDCKNCERAYKYKRDLKKHIRRKHSGLDPSQGSCSSYLPGQGDVDDADEDTITIPTATDATGAQEMQSPLTGVGSWDQSSEPQHYPESMPVSEETQHVIDRRRSGIQDVIDGVTMALPTDTIELDVDIPRIMDYEFDDDLLMYYSTPSPSN